MANSTKLQAVRRELGYSTGTVLRLLAERAEARNIAIMSPASLKTKLSRWENGHEAVGLPDYRRLFREVYGRTSAELGFPDEDDTASPAGELRARLAAARSVDAACVDAFRSMTDHVRRLDRQFVALAQLDQLRAQIAQVENLLTHAPATGQRAALAGASPKLPPSPDGRHWTAPTSTRHGTVTSRRNVQLARRRRRTCSPTRRLKRRTSSSDSTTPRPQWSRWRTHGPSGMAERR